MKSMENIPCFRRFEISRHPQNDFPIHQGRVTNLIVKHKTILTDLNRMGRFPARLQLRDLILPKEKHSFYQIIILTATFSLADRHINTWTIPSTNPNTSFYRQLIENSNLKLLSLLQVQKT